MKIRQNVQDQGALHGTAPALLRDYTHRNRESIINAVVKLDRLTRPGIVTAIKERRRC